MNETQSFAGNGWDKHTELRYKDWVTTAPPCPSTPIREGFSERTLKGLLLQLLIILSLLRSTTPHHWVLRWVWTLPPHYLRKKPVLSWDSSGLLPDPAGNWLLMSKLKPRKNGLITLHLVWFALELACKLLHITQGPHAWLQMAVRGMDKDNFSCHQTFL